MTWNFASVPHERRGGLLWLALAFAVHGGVLVLGFYLGRSVPVLAVGSVTLLVALVGVARWVDSRRVARRVIERTGSVPADGVALYQGVLRSKDPLLRVEVGGQLLKVRTPKTTLARRDARPLTPLERVSVLGLERHQRRGSGAAATIELERALVHPGDAESFRQRILQHGDFYAMRWVAASLTLLLVGVSAAFVVQ